LLKDVREVLINFISSKLAPTRIHGSFSTSQVYHPKTSCVHKTSFKTCFIKNYKTKYLPSDSYSNLLTLSIVIIWPLIKHAT
jgi:hypothetical protein